MSRVRAGWWKTACAVPLLWAAIPHAGPAQTFTTLVSFEGGNGSSPEASLVQGTDGNLHGTTTFGGANNAGTVFEVTPTGDLTTLYSFCAQTYCTDGAYPQGGLVLGMDGNFYGTTYQGGAEGYGTVFKITPAGTLTTLHNFDSTDGAYPVGAPALAPDGNLYGTTSEGGASGCGTVFKITSAGALTTLHSFDRTDGANPLAGLVQGVEGNFYGTTYEGGVNSSCLYGDGCGTAFKITPAGLLITLHSFGFTDGASPEATLVEASDGNFYGTTQYGGASNACSQGCGTAFKITSSGTVTTLQSFNSTDGAGPSAGLLQATDGNFYGTTAEGGAGTSCFAGCGTAFRLTSAGALATLHSFDSADGASPAGGLFQATNGNLYGTTGGGGAGGDGTVFRLAVGLRSFVEAVPAMGTIGQHVLILGMDLTGATSVSFNGTAATFAVVSRSLITTAVPQGAATGAIQVATPSGTLSSNVPFQVE